MLFTGISYLELRQPYCSAEGNHLCQFGRGYLEEHFEFGSVIRRYLLKDFLSGALVALLFGGVEPFMQF